MPALLVGIALLVAAPGSSAAQTRGADGPDIAGGTAAQRALVAELAAVMGADGIESIELGDPPDGFFEGSGAAERVWLTIGLRAADVVASAETTWKALILSGAIYERSRVLGLGRVSGQSITVTYASGRTADGGSTVIEPPAAVGNIVARPAAELVSEVTRSVDASGARLVSVRLVRGLRLAPVVEVEVPDSAAFLTRRPVRVRELLGAFSSLRNPIADGVFLKVADPDGRVIYAQGLATRTAQGVGYVAPAKGALP
jgi:hypothetical protein